jgi:hypothetical protein
MFESNILDTFPSFLAFWKEAQDLSLDDQIEMWASVYMAQWPELLEKQIQSYSDGGYDWRRVAREKVIPFWEERMPSMKRAHHNLLRVCAPVHKRAHEALDYERALSFVIYVGIGCGAGWATTYQGNAAVLCGLENIAEEGWEGAAVLRGMIGHEIGHLWHFGQRAQVELPSGKGPWWDLYTEGLAQRCEQIIAGGESWHMAAQSKDWLSWCEQEKQWLAREFVRVVEEGGDIRVFFGSWFEVRGYKQTGYFLGCEAIRLLEARMTLGGIAVIENVEEVFSDCMAKLIIGHS